MGTTHEWIGDERGVLGRTIRFSVTGIVAVLLLLELPLLLSVFSNTPASQTRFLVYAIPQGLTLAVIVGFPLGAFISLGGRIISQRSAAAVLALAVGCSAVSAGMLTSLVPAANRAARESIAADGTLKPGRNELTFSELRQPRDSATRAGNLEYGRNLDVYYHTRWAFSFAPLAFVLIALSVVTRRPLPHLILGVAFCGILAGYYLLARAGMDAGVRGMLPAFAAAWFPNVAFAVVSAGVASIHQRASRCSGRRGTMGSTLPCAEPCDEGSTSLK